jgi:hypothetical protein
MLQAAHIIGVSLHTRRQCKNMRRLQHIDGLNVCRQLFLHTFNDERQ